jgi:hypothetical protein
MLFVAYNFFGYLLPEVFLPTILIFKYNMGRAISFYLDHGRTFMYKNVLGNNAQVKIELLEK